MIPQITEGVRWTKGGDFTMKVIYLGAFLLLGCKTEATRPPKLLASNSAPPSLFPDSAVYRAQCKEADSLKTLTSIPRKCTPRDQRVKIY